MIETINKLVRTSRQMLHEIGREPTPEELAEARKQNGLRLAAANKAKREAKKEAEKLDAAWVAEEQVETASESGESAPSENGSE